MDSTDEKTMGDVSRIRTAVKVTQDTWTVSD